jgi:hypothetical protein
MLADGTIAAEAGEEAAGDGDVACDLGTEVFGAVDFFLRGGTRDRAPGTGGMFSNDLSSPAIRQAAHRSRVSGEQK